ncbi:Type 1 glutamine amidotransferase-like domain-containing protein [Actomonas aquatica]|uniref:Type 1 glutamine amidotransferase-like domain-containing protein n=1 Tax=Actomonas aquatica TaxID=2866162 RepID=A0ABZ1CD35_9BACT|nr:Type 1 glutamine amidotransferase-like domain-containing protein [Opitutus sp. WL0086]WRQ89575.1 Type 1 glutamine amidotransferase-like domain-containing protein [Opitutus sp. WL0086]
MSANTPNAAMSVLAIGGSMMEGDRFAPITVPTMREHYAGRRSIALVLHATHPDERDAMERCLQAAFRALGDHDAVSLHHFAVGEAARRLAAVDAVFVGGGETFWLLRVLHETGQLDLLRERVAAGLVYGGSSAGANVTGEVIGATNDFPVTDVPSRRALGVLPFVLNPHHPRPEDETAYAERAVKIARYLQFNPTERLLALGDRAMVRLHGGQLTVKVGPAWVCDAVGRRAYAPGEVIAR